MCLFLVTPLLHGRGCASVSLASFAADAIAMSGYVASVLALTLPNVSPDHETDVRFINSALAVLLRRLSQARELRDHPLMSCSG